MLRPLVVFGVLAVFFVCESSGQRFIHPTYKPPPTRPPIYRFRRDTEPLWLNQGDIPRAPATGDHPYLPKYIDDIRLDPHTRVARSYGAPGGSRRGASSPASSSRDTGATHPGYNRRNARAADSGPTLPPYNPYPGPQPSDPRPSKRIPTWIMRH